MTCAEPSTLREISPPRTAFVPAFQKGANYALVVGDKVYTLDTKDQAVSSELNKLAWRQAKVTGTANGDTISVKSVTSAK